MDKRDNQNEKEKGKEKTGTPLNVKKEQNNRDRAKQTKIKKIEKANKTSLGVVGKKSYS